MLIDSKYYPRYVWVVSYCDGNDNEPTVTVFDNKEAAEKCYDAFKEGHNRVAIDEAPVYKQFNLL